MPSWSLASISVVIFTSSIVLPLEVFFTIICEQFAFAFHQSPQVYRPCPDRVEILQRIFGVIDTKVNAFMPMIQQQLSPILKIAIGNVDKRLSEVGQRKQQLLFHALPVPVADFVNPPLRIELIGEEAALMAELFGKESVDECDVVVYAARLEDFLAPKTQADIPLALADVVIAIVVILAEFSFVPPVFNILPQLETQPVGIDLSGMRGDCP